MLTIINRSLAAFLLLFVSVTQAVPIETTGGIYNVTTREGSFLELSSTLKKQVWWGSGGAAQDFATAVGGKLGAQPQQPGQPYENFNLRLGPNFAWQWTPDQGFDQVLTCGWSTNRQQTFCGLNYLTDMNREFAVAELVTLPSESRFLSSAEKAELERISDIMSLASLGTTVASAGLATGIESSFISVGGITDFLLGEATDGTSQKALIKAGAAIGITLSVIGSVALFATGVIPLTATAVVGVMAGIALSLVSATASIFALDPPDLDYASMPVSAYQEASFANPQLEEIMNVALRVADYAGLATQAYEKYQGALIFEMTGVDTLLSQRMQIENYDRYQKLYDDSLENLFQLLAGLGLEAELPLTQEQLSKIAMALESAPIPIELESIALSYGYNPDQLTAEVINRISEKNRQAPTSTLSDILVFEGPSIGKLTERGSTVPEPSTFVLLCLGFASLWFARRRIVTAPRY